MRKITKGILVISHSSVLGFNRKFQQNGVFKTKQKFDIPKWEILNFIRIFAKGAEL